MRLVQASLAAVGAFWSELIPTPSLWDYEGAALADREAAVEVWEPSHADYDDEPLGPCVCECDVCESGDQHCDTASCATIGDDEDFADEPPGGIEVPTLPPGLPFTFNADELVSTASKLIYNHYRRNGVFLDGEAFLAHGAAEVVVSQLVADLTAAYTAAEERAAADSRINRALTDAGFIETGQDMGASMYASEFFPQHTRKPQK